jgi:hypothetical protein
MKHKIVNEIPRLSHLLGQQNDENFTASKTFFFSRKSFFFIYNLNTATHSGLKKQIFDYFFDSFWPQGSKNTFWAISPVSSLAISLIGVVCGWGYWLGVVGGIGWTWVGVWLCVVGGGGVVPTPYVRHSTDCTCCDFGHLRFIFTSITAGARYFQQRYQNKPGLLPVICSTQSQNLSAPKNHPMAIVWKKHTQRRDIPDAE